MRYEFKFTRDYTISESTTRVIEADDVEAARAIAERMAEEDADDLADSVSEDGGGFATDFTVSGGTVTSKPADDIHFDEEA